MIYQRQSGESVTLGKKVASGGEGSIYLVEDDSSLVAKVYHKITDEKARKLSVMFANPPDDPMAARHHTSIAWPTDLLWTIDGSSRNRFLVHPEGAVRSEKIRRLAGFLMPRVENMRPMFDFYNPGSRRKHCPLFDYSYLHRAACNLSSAIYAIHARRYVIGDVNESNILVSNTSLVTLVDTDSFQVNDVQNGIVYRCPVGKAEFTPPELQGKNFSDIDRTPEHDLFGLGVAIYQMLMEGAHPFAGRFRGAGDPPPVGQRISKGDFPHSSTGRMQYAPIPFGLQFSTLNPSLQQLFVQCFVDGHRNPKLRPNAQTWHYTLNGAADALRKCSVNDHHYYSNHLATCPWCERRDLMGGRDAFPSEESVSRKEHLRPPAHEASKPKTSHEAGRHVRPPHRAPSRTVLRPTPTVGIATQWWSLTRHAIMARPYVFLASVAVVAILVVIVAVTKHRGAVNDTYRHALSTAEVNSDPDVGIATLQSVLSKYPDAEAAAVARTRIATIVESAYAAAFERAGKAKTSEEAIREIEATMSKYPDSNQIKKATSKVAQVKASKMKQDKEIDAAITEARGLLGSKSFKLAESRLVNALKDNPYASHTVDATALLEEARRGLAVQRMLDDLLPGARRDAEWLVARRSEYNPVKTLLSSFSETSRENWKKAAERNCPEAQLLMGWCYDLGVGVVRDGDMAADYYRKAAEQGNAWAQFKLSQLNGDLRRTTLAIEAREAWLRKAAEQGLDAAQESLGLCYYHGMQVIVGSREVTCTIEKDPAKAARWFRKAAEQGCPAAQCALGFMQINGDGVAKNPAEAIAWFLKAAEQGISAAQNNLGVMYASGVGVPQNTSAALRWVAKALKNENDRNVAPNLFTIERNLSFLRDGGFDPWRLELVFPDISEAQRRREVWSFRQPPSLTQQTINQGDQAERMTARPLEPESPVTTTITAERAARISQDVEEVSHYERFERCGDLPRFLLDRSQTHLPDWQAAADQGHGGGKLMLGLYNVHCQTGEKKQEGIGMLKAASAKGMREAGYWLGMLYWAKEDASEAANWMRQSAELGHVRACYALGLLLGVEKYGLQNPKEAMSWLAKAAGQGLADAQNVLGMAYFEGKLVTKDLPEAMRWWRKAADQGLDGAQYNLGLMYVNGWGCTKNTNEARKWLRQAAAQNGAFARNAAQLESSLAAPFVMDVYKCPRCGRKQLGGMEGRTDCPKCGANMDKAGQAEVEL